ncbi:GSCOCG00002546001-RA-CDS [Cotesia congregata]|nr:GSCOCG00002546001-RA-CDS [Cotesia congregata]
MTAVTKKNVCKMDPTNDVCIECNGRREKPTRLKSPGVINIQQLDVIESQSFLSKNN